MDEWRNAFALLADEFVESFEVFFVVVAGDDLVNLNEVVGRDDLSLAGYE